jgi:predicted N-formylglutamate amidohydrolase
MVVVSAEHASNYVPEYLSGIFSSIDMEHHEAYDLGVRAALESLQSAFPLTCFLGTISRLVVDLNRSEHNRRLFSLLSQELPSAERELILERYYYPYRKAVLEAIEERCSPSHPVIHLSIHSFTPVFHNEERKADVGLLYDPSRPLEKNFCHVVHQLLSSETSFRVRCNYPYKGVSDGLTTYLRTVFPEKSYIGIEVELNQRLDEKEMVQVCREIIGAANDSQSTALYSS